MVVINSEIEFSDCILNEIPKEIILHIMKFMKNDDLIALLLTCKRMLGLIFELNKKVKLQWNNNSLLNELITWKETHSSVTEIYWVLSHMSALVSENGVYGSKNGNFKNINRFFS